MRPNLINVGITGYTGIIKDRSRNYLIAYNKDVSKYTDSSAPQKIAISGVMHPIDITYYK